MAITSTGSTKLGGTSIHIVIDPSRTYLRTSGDSALGAIAIDLAALPIAVGDLPIAAGDVLLFEQTGDYDPDGAGPDFDDSATGMTGVFSTSSTLLTSNNLNRVSGAVVASDPVFGGQLPGVVTLNTVNGGLVTDITQDFEVFSDDVTVTSVPAGAGFLFVSPFDEFFSDNTDLDGDFGINIYRPMVVGAAGVGTLTITGGTEYRDVVVAGAAAAGNGALTIQSAAILNIGGNPTPDGAYTSNGVFIVGLAGTGAATISGGSIVTVEANGTYSNVQIGEYAGGVGTVTVTGAGSKLISSGDDNVINVGREGVGTLKVEAGGYVQTLGLSVARAGTGTVNVSGAGSHLVVSNDTGGYAYYAPQAGFSQFGRNAGSVGTLNVTAGGVFDVRNSTDEDNPTLRFGRNSGSIGVGVVDGAGSEINITQSGPNSPGYYGPQLILGNQGDGTLTVRNGGAVNLIGDSATLFVSAAGYVDGSPPTKLLSLSELLIQTGGVVTVDHQGYGYDTVNVGNNQFGNGAIRISGVGSKLISEGVGDEIVIGNRGIGLLTIGVGGAGAEVLGQRMFVGNDVGGVGTVTLDGLNSKLTLSSSMILDPGEHIAGLWVGNLGKGTMTVSNKATVDISGAESRLFVGEAYNAVGPGSVGVLNLLSGGVVTVDHGTDATGYTPTVHIGSEELGVGTINVAGAGSKLVSLGSHDVIHVGDQGVGTLNVTAGGEVEGQLMFVGTNETATGTVLVNGATSKITLTSPNVFDENIGTARMWVGNRGNGTMTVSSNAQVSIAGAYSHLFVGDGYGLYGPGGTGLLTIQSGGKVTVTNTDTVNQSGNIDIGVNEFGKGTITVTGAGSTLTAAGTEPYIGVGNDGTGVLNVLSGGKVVSLFMNVGNNDGSDGTLNIAGAGSKVVLSNDTHTEGFYGDIYGGFVAVGNQYGASGVVNISAGGVLEIRNSIGGDENAPGMQIGNQQGSLGTVTVDGTGSAINITQVGGVYGFDRGGAFMQVGKFGDGTLTVRNNAQVNITGEYGLFRVSRGDEGASEESPLSEAFIQSGADVKINMTGGTYYGAVAMIGGFTNANGKLTVDGTGSTFTVIGNNEGNTGSETARLLVARQGKGELVVINGADVVVNGGDDKRPLLSIGQFDGAIGTLLITGAGSTINLQTTNTEADGGGLITVGASSGSSGTLNISTGAQLINDLGSNNSIMTVGQAGEYGAYAASVGQVTVDGNGNATTLLDAGQLLVVGAGWDELGSTITNVDFAGGGTGSVVVLNGATVRANDTAVGVGGTIGGNGKFDGNVTVDGGDLIIGASPGILTITGALDVANTTLDFEVNGLTAGTQYDQLKVTGAVTITDTPINVDINGTSFNFVDGNRIVLIDGVAPLTVDINAINVAITNEPAALAYSIADEGADLVFEALNNGTGAALVSFGATSTNGATATINNGVVTGNGGRFNSVRSVGATGIEGTAGADFLSSTGTQAMTLLGLGGNDTLSSLGAADIMDGGVGLDTVSYQNVVGPVTVALNGALAATVGGGATGDVIKNIENIIGSAAGDTLTGDTLANVIEGGAGADILDGKAGLDTVSFASSALAVNVALNGALAATVSGGDAAGDTITNFENVIGSANDDTLTGDGLVNILTGGAGNDRLDGGVGADTMIGGLDDDTYVVGIATDKVTELANQGTDTIETSLATFSLAALTAVENLTYDNGVLADVAFTGTGNALDNIITGGAGNDTLTGGLGIDTLIGLGGDDVYKVDNTLDVASEVGGSGIDRVDSTATFTLGTDVENLTLLGALAINGTGNASVNVITGNTGANIIEGKGDADILDGKTGLDTLSYASSAVGVTVLLNGATVVTQGGLGDALGDKTSNFENIIGSAAGDTLTGDTLANVIEGGAGADILDGKAGLDTVSFASSALAVNVALNGALAATVSGGDAAGDTITNFENVIGSANDDTLTGDGLVNILTGGAGNDRLDGGVGADTMIGGLDDDTYVVGIATDKVTELANQGTDTIETSLATFSLAALTAVENLTYDNGVLADVAFTGTGNALDNIITGGAGNDTLTGGLGIDTLIGLGGDDVYKVDNTLDVASEVGGSGIDRVDSTATFTLGTDVENLTLLGALAINGTGNASVNVITGNTGANIIEGKGDADILDGKTGLDTLSYASSAVGVTVLLNGATVVTQGGLGDALGDKTSNFENIIGSAAGDTLTGDTLANVIEGGAGADILDGKAGLDTVSFASSALAVNVALNGALAATVSGGDAAGDTITNFENVIGSANDDTLTGDGLVNILTGGAGNDRLDGGVGADTMIGGLDDDTYVVGIATDKVTELANQGTDTIETSLATFSLAALTAVENLTYDNGVLADVAFTGTGNALANTITGGDGADKLSGGTGADTLIGGAGNDTLTGGTQNDQFIFADFVLAGDFGNDKITDFAGGVGVGDVVQIDDSWGFATEADVVAALTILGADKILVIDGDTSITFVGKAGLTFNADDFLII